MTNTGETFRCTHERNLLAGMEQLGRKGIPVGCRNGGCGVCKVRVIEGEVDRRKMSRAVIAADEEQEGYALACRIYPRSDLRVDVVGKMARAVEARQVGSNKEI
ncbi:2Fe-2S iron-sulfur cluster binding domain-containing protein [Variovorax sp. Sphag1AA]|uniref:2Fe-2S iron-sulfur cluster-binding protein n=1 Tax=Variovorax sp. Sphag1AA TaxID=2587027 RepID=UPI00288ADBED|nr:2Fe-2S iron-sulfur cluster binding domain-containing protein [Variovorax sp. Sphag1AA]